MVAGTIVWSLLGFFVMGLCGALTLIQVSVVLSAKHGLNRTRAISEANVLASFCAVLAPLVIGAAEALRFGWRAGVALAPLYLLLLALGYGRAALPLRATAAARVRTPLPGRYWRHWTTLVLCVATEFGVMFWAVDFLGVGGSFSPAGAERVSGNDAVRADSGLEARGSARG